MVVEGVCSNGQEPPAAINHTDSRSAAHEAVRPAAVESPGRGSYSGLEIHPPLATCQPLCSLCALCPLCLLSPAVCSCILPCLRCSHLVSTALPQYQDLGDAQELSKVLDRMAERSVRCKSVKKKKKKHTIRASPNKYETRTAVPSVKLGKSCTRQPYVGKKCAFDWEIG